MKMVGQNHSIKKIVLSSDLNKSAMLIVSAFDFL